MSARRSRTASPFRVLPGYGAGEVSYVPLIEPGVKVSESVPASR